MSDDGQNFCERLAIYPGTFDPVTYGHLDIIERASNLFDRVVVALGINAQKQPLFSDTERAELLSLAIRERELTNVQVRTFSGLLAQFAHDIGAIAIIRGMRALSDFDYEFQLALTNRKLFPGAETVFLMPKETYVYLSSSMVKVIAQNAGDVSYFVPPCVEKELKKKFGGK